MKAKLIKEKDYYDLYKIDEDGKRVTFASTEDYKQKLSKQNCDEIFGVVDVEKLADSIFEKESSNMLHPQHQMRNTFILGFNKAMELNKDKVFSKGDMAYIMNIMSIYELSFEDAIIKFQSLQQPTEIEVEIEMKKVVDKTKVIGAVKGVKGSGDKITTYKSVPKLDSEGCLILKKK